MKKFLILILLSAFSFIPVFADSDSDSGFDTYHEYSEETDGEFAEKYIKKGSRVEHPEYGQGTVLQVIDYKGKVVYSVLFDKASKKFVKPNSIKKL